MEPTVIRSRRKTISLECGPAGLIVRAPQSASDAQIRSFLAKHARWIEIHSAKQALRRAEAAQAVVLTEEELRSLVQRAKPVFASRAAFFAPRIGVDYGKITVRSQHTRWGSCSSRGDLSFNCLLLLAPPAVLDSVVVHELCHRKEMNHSSRFYAEVLRVMPDYPARHAWLREHGSALLAKLPGK